MHQTREVEVFPFELDEAKNQQIRNAIRKRIVRQRELDDEEASTEEDEAFLAGPEYSRNNNKSSGSSGSKNTNGHTPNDNHNSNNSLAAAVESRSADLSPTTTVTSATGETTALDLSSSSSGTGSNAKSRWKREYQRTVSSSPTGSFINIISEILPEILPDILPGSLLGSSEPINTDRRKEEGSQQQESADAISTTTATTTTQNGSLPTPPLAVPQEASAGESSSTAISREADATIETTEIPQVDEEEMLILRRLEELHNEKHRLFQLFKSTLAQSTPAPNASQPQADHEQQNSVDPQESSHPPQAVGERSGKEAEKATAVPTAESGSRLSISDLASDSRSQYGSGRGGSGFGRGGDDTKNDFHRPSRPQLITAASTPAFSSSHGGGSRKDDQKKASDLSNRSSSSSDRSKLDLSIPSRPRITNPTSSNSIAVGSGYGAKRHRSISPPLSGHPYMSHLNHHGPLQGNDAGSSSSLLFRGPRGTLSGLPTSSGPIRHSMGNNNNSAGNNGESYRKHSRRSSNSSNGSTGTFSGSAIGLPEKPTAKYHPPTKPANDYSNKSSHGGASTGSIHDRLGGGGSMSMNPTSAYGPGSGGGPGRMGFATRPMFGGGNNGGGGRGYYGPNLGPPRPPLPFNRSGGARWPGDFRGHGSNSNSRG